MKNIKVIDKIKKEQIKMRPKIYFTLRTLFISLITLLVALFVLYLISFIIFNLRASGVWFLPKFGFSAMGIFFKSLPWLLILIAIVLIIVLELLVKHFRFAYRRPVLYSILGIIILTILGSFLIGRANLHPNLFWKARQGKLYMVGGFYRGFGAPKLPNVHRGIVTEIIDKGFYLETPRGEILTIVVASNNIEKSDRVVILGKRDNGIVRAFKIRRINQPMTW